MLHQVGVSFEVTSSWSNFIQLFGSLFVTEVSIKIVIIYDKPPMFGSLKILWKKLLPTSSTLETNVAVLLNDVTLFVTIEAVTTQVP